MTPMIDNIWDLLTVEYTKYNTKNPNFKFNENKKAEFESVFKKKYNHIITEYMDDSVNELDRHKVSALIIISLLEVNAISIENLDSDFVFVGNELLALKVGLAYMVQKLNEKLVERNIEKQIGEFVFPVAQSCKTPYIDIMCRNLYYAKNDYVLNPLDLADRLFLIEYITLLKENINPDILKDY